MKNLRQMLRRAGWLNARKRKVRPRNDLQRRRLSSQALEKRELLAGDVGIAHNGWNGFDVNDDRRISALDALIGINRLGQMAEAESIEADGMFVDVNNDGKLTANDPLQVINALGRGEELGELVELRLTARDLNDNPITPDASGRINVDINEEFLLEVSYNDLRRGDDRIGVFQLLVDLEASSGLKPVLNETQRVRFNDEINTPFIQVENTLPTGTIMLLAEVKTTTFNANGDQIDQDTENLLKTFEFIESGSATGDNVGILTRHGSGEPLLQAEIADALATQINANFFDTEIRPGGNTLVPVLDPDADGNTVFIRGEDAFLGIENQADVEPANASGSTSKLQGEFIFVQEGTGIEYRSDIADFEDNPKDEIENALMAFEYAGQNYTADQFKIDRLGSGVGYDITFTDYDDFGNVDLPDFSVSDNLNINIPVTFQEFAPFKDGSVNSDAVRFNINSFSRTFKNNEEFYSNLNQGAFAEATGFDEVGGVGGVPAGGNGIPELDPTADLSDPFDAFSFRVFFDSAGSGIDVSVNPGEDAEATLLYGRNAPVPQDLILVDGDATVTFNVNGGANNLPTGLPIITGTVQEDETLTANTSGIADADGLTQAEFSYQWLRGGSAISGATDSTYVLGDADVGQRITVQVTYTDDLGTAEGPLTSAETDQVAPADNNLPVGVPTITGTAQEDETLTAVTSGISDADGLGPFSFQWLRGGGAISGATGTTYVLGDDDVGQRISVQVSYTDDEGTNEGPLTSAQTNAVANVNDEPSGVPTITGTAQEDETLTAVTSGISDDDGLGAFSYQWLRNGAAIGGATGTTYVLGDADVDQRISVQVSYTDDQGTNEGPLTSAQTGVVANVNDEPSGVPSITGLVQKDETLTAVTSVISDADGLGPFSYQWLRGGGAINGATDSTYVLVAADVGQRISVQVSYTDDQGTAEGPLTSTQTGPVGNVNNLPTGVPTINGTVREDQTLTADTSGIADEDGLGPFSYQWLRGGGAINGATGSSYVLGDADVGQRISVQVSYTDDLGTAEGPLTSAQTSLVENVNDAPEVSGPINRTFNEIQGATLIDLIQFASDVDDVDLNVVESSVVIREGDDLNGDGVEVRGNDLFVNPSAYEDLLDFGESETIVVDYDISDGELTVSTTVTVTIEAIPPTMVTGLVYIDKLNGDKIRNGVKDADEYGIGGLMVHLRPTAGGSTRTVLTDADGDYAFEGVVPGTYEVEYDLPDSAVIVGSSVSTIVVGQTDPPPDVLRVLGFTGTLGTIDIIASTYLSRLGMSVGSSGEFEGAKFGLDGDSQDMFVLLDGYDGVEFAEFTLNTERDAALLSLVDGQGEVRTALLGEDSFVLSPDGRAAALLGGMDDFNFSQSVDAILGDFPGFGDSTEDYLDMLE